MGVHSVPAVAPQAQGVERAGTTAEVLGPGESTELSILAPRFAERATPWRQILGYVGSLMLTMVALLAVVRRWLPVHELAVMVLALAGLQAAWQLTSFMHLRESRGSAWHILTLFFGIGVGLGVVGFSIWIMMFKSGVS